jgi:beta-xylosidase
MTVRSRFAIWRKTAERAPGRSPVFKGDFPDPCLIRDGTAFYAYATNAGRVNVQLIASGDLTNWRFLGDALPVLPRWAERGNTWAPGVMQQGDGWILYYAVREPVSGRQGISVATSNQPGGPFVDNSTAPLLLQLDHGGSIDPCPFVDVDGARYLLWKTDDNAIGQVCRIWGQPLDESGTALVGQPIELLRQDRPWEDPLIEAPSMVLVDGTYYLFYSANWWESDRYGIGYAKSRAPLGDFTKVTTDGPWLSSDDAVAGPGGEDFCTDASGQHWMAYHGWRPGRVGYRVGGVRSLYVRQVDFTTGEPVIQP